MSSSARKIVRNIPLAVYRPRDAALYFNISLPTLWRWERLGKIPTRDFKLADGRVIGWKVETLSNMGGAK